MSELGAPIEDKPFVMDILSKLPGNYDVIIERINEILDEDEICKYDVLEMLQEKVRSRYDRMKREYNKKTPSYKKNEPEEDKASYSGGKFKRICYRFRKYGHKGTTCNSGSENEQYKIRSRKGTNKEKKFPGLYYNCGKQTIEHTIFLMEKDKVKRRKMKQRMIMINLMQYST